MIIRKNIRGGRENCTTIAVVSTARAKVLEQARRDAQAIALIKADCRINLANS